MGTDPDDTESTKGLTTMRVAIGSDHAGFALTAEIRAYLTELGHEVVHVGTFTPEPADYPVYGAKVGHAVVDGQADTGIAVCGTGIGISIAANKVPGVRAAACSEAFSARLARQHNDANVLSFGGRVVGIGVAKMMVDEWLSGQFQGGRHGERVALIARLDDGEQLG